MLSLKNLAIAASLLVGFGCGGSSSPGERYRDAIDSFRGAAETVCTCASDEQACVQSFEADTLTEEQVNCQVEVIDAHADEPNVNEGADCFADVAHELVDCAEGAAADDCNQVAFQECLSQWETAEAACPEPTEGPIVAELEACVAG